MFHKNATSIDYEYKLERIFNKQKICLHDEIMLGRNICNMVRLHDYTVIPNKTENKSQQKKKKRKKN